MQNLTLQWNSNNARTPLSVMHISVLNYPRQKKCIEFGEKLGLLGLQILWFMPKGCTAYQLLYIL